LLTVFRVGYARGLEDVTMLRADSVLAQRLATFGLALGLAMAVAAPASAQQSGCMDVQKILLERKGLVERISAAGQKKKMDAQEACGLFNKLVANGTSAVKWIETNKEWCQVPNEFADGVKTDHNKAVAIRGKACAAANQQAQMQKRAKEGGGDGSGLLGGGGLSGSYKMPQGAL
jgi:hypothetical protein